MLQETSALTWFWPLCLPRVHIMVDSCNLLGLFESIIQMVCGI